MRSITAVKIGTILFFLLNLVRVSAFAGTLIVSPKNDMATAIAKVMASQIAEASIVSSIPEGATYDLLITIGNDAFQQATGAHDRPHIAAFVSYNIFNDTTIKKRPGTYAIYSDPNPHDVALYIQKCLDKPRIAYIYTDKFDPYLKLFKKEFITIKDSPVLDNDIFRTLSSIYQPPSVDAFFISENREIYNKSNILLVLESLFRNRLPVISTNIAFYKKGSLLTIYVDPDDITNQTIETAKKLLTHQSIQVDTFVRSTTKTDVDLAKHLNVTVGGLDD